jgi:hypothetical protein
MIVIPSREDNASPARTERPRRFQFRHPTYLVCSNSFGEILHFVQDDSAFVVAGA